MVDMHAIAGAASWQTGQEEVAITSARQRRQLEFDDISQVVPEVRRLMPAHYTVGNWTLGQICKHLADGFVGATKGFDLSNHRIKRFFFRRQILKATLANGIPANYTVDPNITPPPNVDLHEAVEGLATAVEAYKNFEGQLHAHPLFGRMSRKTWNRVHCVHCAHHLSFVIATDALT